MNAKDILKKEFIEEKIAPILESYNLELVIINIKGKKLEILLDGKTQDTKVSLNNCTKITKILLGHFEENEELFENFILEIASAGLDRPLFTEKDYKKFINSKVKLILKEKITKRNRIVGKLVDYVNDNVIVLDNRQEKINIPIKLIKKANLVAEF